jgi:putative transposase
LEVLVPSGRPRRRAETVDFLLTARRDADAAGRFFERFTDFNGVPEKTTIDRSGAT